MIADPIAREDQSALPFSAVEAALAAPLDAQQLHPLWTGKRAEDGGVAVASRSHSAAEVGRALHLSAIHMAFGGLAIARVDDWASGWAALHLLFRTDGRWLVAGTASAGEDVGRVQPNFRPTDDEQEVLAVLAAYYSAVRDGDPSVIERIFSPAWEMKNHEAGALVREDKAAFVARIAAGPLPGYDDDRRIADVQVLNGVLAYVRVDRPSRPSTTVFLFMREGGAWRMIDKAWIDGQA